MDDKTNKAHYRRLEAEIKQLEKIFTKDTNALVSLATSINLDPEQVFKFKDYPELKARFEKLQRKFYNDISSHITTSISHEWNAAQEDIDSMADDFISSIAPSVENTAALETLRASSLAHTRNAALSSFITRKTKGMNLSQRVWKITDQNTELIEIAVSQALQDGTAATKLSQEVRQYLNNPDKLFRRVRGANGNLKLSKAAQAYHPGPGQYRSAYKNAMRLARTEINMAYRSSEYERNQDLDFVVGIEVKRSNHVFNCSVCESLKGKYPKDFKFTGWHPQCRCFTTSILVDEEVFIGALNNDTPLDTTKSAIKDVPPNYKQWLADNTDRINRAKAKGTLPYFMRDNKAYSGLETPKPKGKTKFKSDAEKHAVQEAWNVRNRKLAIKAAAKKRHSKRDTNAIRSAWYERKAVNKYAHTVLNYMSGISDIDTTLLAEVVKGGKNALKEQQAKLLAKQGKEILALKYLDDPMAVARQFSKADAIVVNNAVEAKLKSWSTLSLADQRKKLQFEINWIGEKKKYDTWEVAQNAFKKELARVEYLFNKGFILNDNAVYLSFAKTTKSAAAKTLATEFDLLIKNNAPIADLQKKAAELSAKVKPLIKAKERRIKTKRIALLGEDYSQERKNAALWAKSAEEADSKLRNRCGEVWKNATKKEREAAYYYTHTYCPINEPLRGLNYIGSATKLKTAQSKVNDLTSIISKSTYDFDMWLQRGVGYDNMLGVNLRNMSEAEAQSLIGNIIQDNAFISCSNTKGMGFSQKPIIFNIYCPRNTKALYLEPFSDFGHGAKSSNWDGITTQSSFGHEAEVLLQRGSQFRVVKIEYNKSTGKWYIDIDVIEQPI